ncbi:MAG: hypothetical protein HC779_08560 [Phyllobacteriaceae bacterium]|nr:hypothetical protein [Phyllobacteriaceae bacterium]
MTLSELAAELETDIVAFADAGLHAVTGVTADSRAVAPGMVFVALKGVKTDGAAFAAAAVEKGAVAIIAGLDAEIEALSVPVMRVADPHHALAKLAARLAGAQPETIVAVTGTSGKTSVAAFTRQIWAHCGYVAASLGTVGVVSPVLTEEGSLTTPDPVELHATLKTLADGGVTHAAMEASSHGLEQRRQLIAHQPAFAVERISGVAQFRMTRGEGFDHIAADRYFSHWA